MVWLTLQFDSVLLLVDPVIEHILEIPLIKKCIAVPSPGRGPHVITEYGEELLVSLKDSHHVLKINQSTNQHVLYSVPRNPVFVAKHPISGDIYVSCDQSSAIIRTKDRMGVVEMKVPKEYGSTPVGLVAGTDNNIWFMLAKRSAEGSGVFAKFFEDGKIEYMTLPNALAFGKKAGLMHLSFKETADKVRNMYLLSTSLLDSSCIDAVFHATLNNKYSRIETIETAFTLPTQSSKTHRILPTTHGVFVTELAVSALAYIHYSYTHQPKIDETSDFYSFYGIGERSPALVYAVQ